MSRPSVTKANSILKSQLAQLIPLLFTLIAIRLQVEGSKVHLQYKKNLAGQLPENSRR